MTRFKEYIVGIYIFFPRKILRIAQQEYYSNDSTTTKSVDQLQTLEIEQGINVMGLENDWEECENHEDEVKGERVGGNLGIQI